MRARHDVLVNSKSYLYSVFNWPVLCVLDTVMCHYNRANLSKHDIWHYDNSGRKWIRYYNYNSTPYLALTGELWGVYCEDFGENWPHHNSTPLYYVMIYWTMRWKHWTDFVYVFMNFTVHHCLIYIFIVRRAGLLWSQRHFEWRWSVRLFKCLTVLDLSFILFDLCLLITFFNFIMNYVPIVTFWIFTYHKIWILSIMFCFIWSYWIIYFLACL